MKIKYQFADGTVSEVEVSEELGAYSRFAVKRGCVPVTPHLLFPQFLNDNDKSERELGLVMGKILLTKCKEVWVFGDRISSGMSQEIKKAKWRGMPIRYFTADLQEVKK